ncbi:26S proteasome non-ATPase regulatory subunit 12-like [Hydractinia symbiolongicarpus]|uniref:26S proteasome non-ATPase regulatory subunit 12-like n=1 Tax=Hydractinia symbiolongicarpus TaxID=13093 RepID=UPI00254C4206|nr:26S proteasome non-ATPase regulatory subunit 12-like [Hydractinia symbiolongicarpus]
MASETITDMKGNIVKMEVDYSETCDKKIPECEEMAKSGKLIEALEALLSLEKQTRTAADMFSTSRILVAVIKICYSNNNLDMLTEHLVVLTKRRGQLKQAVTKMVQEACTYVDDIENKENKLKLIDTLRTVTAGKIYLELERARITRKLAVIKENDGDITEAANILQELQVETYGSMEKREKVEYILEQMRLCLAKKDFIRTQIISKKVSIKFFEDEKQQDLKLKYYQLMIELCHQDGKYLPICRHYNAVYSTPCIQEDQDKMKEALRNVVLYVILSPHDNEQADFLARISQEAKLEEISLFKSILKNFTTAELIDWTRFKEMYEKELCEGSADNPATNVFNKTTEDGKKRWDDLKKRVVEHNIRVMEKYYTQITMQKMAHLLDLSVEDSEKFLSDLVTSKTVFAKIDRPAGIVVFRPPKEAGDTLNEWSRDISELMNLLNKTTHLITKEKMVHQLLN